MTIATDTFTVTPLSQFTPRNSLAEFVVMLKYEGRGARERFEADHLLLDQLHAELRRAAQFGALGTVGELDEARIRQCIEYVEDRFPTWRLAGEDRESVCKRLDRHFRPEQERWAKHRREQEEHAVRQREASARFDAAIAERDYRQYRSLWGLPA